MKTNKFKILSITAVLSLLFVSCGDAEKPTYEGENTIASVVARTETSLDSLGVALVRTNLVSTFEGGTAYTVFAPTNEAFVALLGALNYTSIEEVPVSTLTAILKYHVTTGSALSSSFTNNQVVTTLEGSTFNVLVTPATPEDQAIYEIDGFSSDAVVSDVNFDWQCSNGVIHVIDTILLPEFD